MENHHRHKSTSSGDNFTFPAMSPDMETDSELADHLFSNGKLLFHTFPLQPKSLTSYNLSRTCSISSKDSLVSSRSTSTNSRSSSTSSSCSSARTSTSESPSAVPMRATPLLGNGSRSPGHYNNNYYFPAQSWQFMAPVPVLNRRTSQRRKTDEQKQKGSPVKKKYDKRKGYFWKIFHWLVSTCKECHAIEPSKKTF